MILLKNLVSQGKEIIQRKKIVSQGTEMIKIMKT